MTNKFQIGERYFVIPHITERNFSCYQEIVDSASDNPSELYIDSGAITKEQLIKEFMEWINDK